MACYLPLNLVDLIIEVDQKNASNNSLSCVEYVPQYMCPTINCVSKLLRNS